MDMKNIMTQNPFFANTGALPSRTVHFLQSTQVLNHYQATNITIYSITIFKITFTYQILLQHLYKFQSVQTYIRSHGHMNKWFTSHASDESVYT
jgi:hypothetical protein